MQIRSLPRKIAGRLLRLAERVELGRDARLRDDHLDCFVTIDRLRRHWSSGGVLYDIGAYRGNWAKVYCQLVDGVETVVHFEPQAIHQAQLASQRLRAREVRILPVGLGSERGDFQLKGGGASASVREATELQHRHFPGTVSGVTEQIRIEILDELARREKLPRPDVVKLDVQGLELEVMRGGEECLAAAQWLVIELSCLELYSGQATLGEHVSFLEQRGWRLVDMGYVWRTHEGEIAQFDGIFNNRRRASRSS